MFSGLVRHLGSVADFVRESETARLSVLFPDALLAGRRVGDSIAVNGCCLTVTAVDAHGASFDVGPRTLAGTAPLAVGERVHLEAPLCAGETIDGHFVSGHIDGLAKLAGRSANGRCVDMTFVAPDSCAAYLAPRGSAAVNGVSLTIAASDGPRFEVQLVPQTLRATALGGLRIGALCNFEADCLARYAAHAVRC